MRAKPELELAYCAVRFHPSVVVGANRAFGDPQSAISFERLTEQVERVYQIVGQYVPVIIQEDFDGPDDGFAEDLGMSSLNGTPGWLQFRPVPENRRGAASRLTNKLIRGGFLRHDDVVELPEGAFAEGGDVNNVLELGLSFVGIPQNVPGRTNDEGRAVTRRFIEAHGSRCVEVEFDGLRALHLTTCSSVLGPNKDGVWHVLCNRFVDPRPYQDNGFEVIHVADDEAWGANALHIPVEGAPLILQAGYPRLASQVRASGYDNVVEVPWDEVQKADGSLTCLGKFGRLRVPASSPL